MPGKWTYQQIVNENARVIREDELCVLKYDEFASMYMSRPLWRNYVELSEQVMALEHVIFCLRP